MRLCALCAVEVFVRPSLTAETQSTQRRRARRDAEHAETQRSAQTYAKRWNLDSALARTFRLFVCSDLSRTRQADAEVSSDRCRCFVDWTCDSRLGGRTYSKEFAVSCFGAVCLHKESSLPGKLHSGPRVHDCFGSLVTCRCFCGLISGHLFPGDARRSLDIDRLVR